MVKVITHRYFVPKLPEACSSPHTSFQGTTFKVEDAALGFSVTLFTICAVTAIAILMLRRNLAFFGNAELGGPVGPRWISFGLLITLWVTYILLASLQAYDVIKVPF